MADRRVYLNNQLNIQNNFDHGRYLGLPSLVGKRKKSIFAFLKDMLQKRLQSWNHRFLSQAGKEILLKSVAQALPTFCMSLFLIPASFCQELQRMMNSFW